MDEKEAICLLKRGQIAGLEVLVRKYQVRAMRAAYLVTGDAALAEDIVQEAFLRAFERIGQFDAERSFGPWFVRSVVNDSVKVATRRSRLVPLVREADDEGQVHDALVDPDPGPEEWLERLALSDTVGEALRTLSPQRRAAVVLRYYLELSEPEIAGRLRWPLGTVKRRLHDARRHLRVLLGATRSRQSEPTLELRGFRAGATPTATPGMEVGGKP